MRKNTEVQRLLANPATSNWLKNAITSARERDVVDALNDAEILLQVMTAECARACYDNCDCPYHLREFRNTEYKLYLLSQDWPQESQHYE